MNDQVKEEVSQEETVQSEHIADPVLFNLKGMVAEAKARGYSKESILSSLEDTTAWLNSWEWEEATETENETSSEEKATEAA